MLKYLIICSCLQLFLGLMLFRSIACECMFPEEKFSKGRILYESPEDVNETIAKEHYVLQFKCFNGYTIIGPKFIQCVEGEWTDEVPICTRMRCSYPPDVDNAKYTLHTGVNNAPTLGSTAVYSCTVGYELNNTDASTLRCGLEKGAKKGRWKGEIPVCKEKDSCPDPGVSEYGTREGVCCFSGEVLSFSCNDGYELVGNEEIQCLYTGTWSSGRPLCRPLEDHCVPPSIPHGVVIGEKDGDYFIPDFEAEILCAPGYKYEGPSEFILCEEGGEWEHEFFECTEIFCDLPEPLENGTIPELQTPNATSFPYDFELTYLCDEGYRLLGGDSWRTCGKKGWSGKTPYCEAVECPDPGVPEDGYRTGDNFGVGEKVRFSCFTEYHLLGSVERYCMPNGQWTGELARCDMPSNHCPNPGIPIKGSKNSTIYDLGSQVRFHCQAGYFQLGSEVRECLSNRMWSGTETKCLGPFDFDNSAQVRDILQAKLAEKAEEQKMELQKFEEAWHSTFLNGSVPSGRVLDINFPGRIVLYFAFDVSGSVGERNFEKSIEFAKAIVKKVGISENGARAGALTFSSEALEMFLPLNYNTTIDVLDALDRINFTGGGTAASSALTLIQEEFLPLSDAVFGKSNIKSVVFILTDGKANMGGSPVKQAEELKAAGVEIYCIGITGSIEKKSLYKIASSSANAIGEEHPNVFILQNYAAMPWLIEEITNGAIDYSQCGLGMENIGNEASRGRIVGGRKSTEPWPWMAALYMNIGKRIPEFDLQCGGSIIHQNFILTAAHCLYHNFAKRDKRDIIVKLGLTDVRNESYVQEFEISKIITHPKYRVGDFYNYDIALLELVRPIEYNTFVRPLCLPPIELPEKSRLYSSNEFGWATGWGYEGLVRRGEKVRMKTTEKLKEIVLPIQSRERCMQSLLDQKVNGSYFTDLMFCAGDGKRGSDTCQGDSGGPLMQSQLNSEGYLYWTQVGIVSWGIGCGQENTYGYYSHLQRLRPWVDATIETVLKQEE